MPSKKAYINSTGSYLPNHILKNSDLEKMVDTTDEWIVSRTGIRERRIAEKGEFASDMGFEAAMNCLEKAKLHPNKIDLIIVATLTPDHIFPSTACLIQKKLKSTNAAAFDLQAACSGLIYALAVAKSFIESGAYRSILVIGTEKLSSIIDYEDRSTCVLFGDGAAACLVQNEGPGLEIRESVLGSDGNQNHLLILPGGGCKSPSTKETVDNKSHFLKMDGREIFKHAVRRMEQSMVETIEKAQMSYDKIDWLVPHQANIRIIDALAKRCGVSADRVIKMIEKYGNTSASSIGICLDEMLENGSVEEDQNLLLVAFGAGLTWGSMILTMRGVAHG